MKKMSTSSSRNSSQVSVARRVTQVLNSRLEHKRAVSTSAAIDWTTAGVVSLLSTDVAQGDNIGNRSGDMIRPLRLTFRLTSAVTTGQVLGRIIVFQDSMCNGSTPAVTDVLETANVLAPLKAVAHQARRFKILNDFHVINILSTQLQVVEVTRTMAMKGAIHYVSSAGSAGSAGRNTIYVLFISDSAGTAGQKFYSWSYDLEYLDA